MSRGGAGAAYALICVRRIALRTRQECHAGGVVTDIRRRAPRREARAGQLLHHRRFGVAGETEVRAQAPVVGDEGAPEPDQRGAEKAIARGKMNKRGRIAQGRDMRRDDVAQDEDAVCAQKPAEQDEQLVELLRAEVLRDRVQHHDVDRPGGERRDLLRRAHLDLRIIAEAAAQGGAHHGSGLAQDQPAGSLGDDVRVQCLAAAVVEHGGAGRQVCADVLRNPAVMHVAMASIDVDRMFGIPEGDPVAHSLGPRLAPSGRAGLYGNRRRLPGLISYCRRPPHGTRCAQARRTHCRAGRRRYLRLELRISSVKRANR